MKGNLIKLYEGTGGSTDVAMDIELFIRALEWAREEAKSDVEVHRFAERAEALSQSGRELSMDDYDELVGSIEVVGSEEA